MSVITRQMQEDMENGSWIRRMFEAGIQLKQQYGEDGVCDFSLGNPDVPPPAAVIQGLRDLALVADKPFSLGYMPNAGFGWAREQLAAHIAKEQGFPLAKEQGFPLAKEQGFPLAKEQGFPLTKEQGFPLAKEHAVTLTGNDVLLTCGAAGGLNVLFKSILEPGDEVLAMRPYFVEYGFYVRNHGGVFNTISTQPNTFRLDIDAIAAAITPKTRAVIINSPNNPTGVVYSRAELAGLIGVLEQASARNKRPVFLVSDEPYRFLTFEGVEVPAILPLYPFAVVASSFSKNLSLSGERVGYLALSPLMEERATLMTALAMANRILGFVNPPVVGQHLMAAALAAQERNDKTGQVDVAIYARRRELMASILREAGYDFQMPVGAFYFFPKAPGGDDIAFAQRLVQERVLVVPGTGFGGPGHFRLAFCTSEDVILRAAPGLKRAMA